MPEHGAGYRLVAVKRQWVPEWLFWLARPVAVYPPLRWLLTEEVG